MTIPPRQDIQTDLAQLRNTNPLVHCLTNIVASSFTANVLLALGASPAMINEEQEAAEFASIASGLLINLGTVTAASARAMHLAAASAQASGTPWVLDPVAMGAVSFRSNLARELLNYQPTLIRGNASEIMALAGVSTGGKGVDSIASSSAAVDAARTLAHNLKTVVAVSGATDYITDGIQLIEVSGGHVMMTRVTGTGCALGAVMAAFLGTGRTPIAAASTASTLFAHAASLAFG